MKTHRDLKLEDTNTGKLYTKNFMKTHRDLKRNRDKRRYSRNSRFHENPQGFETNNISHCVAKLLNFMKTHRDLKRKQKADLPIKKIFHENPQGFETT